MMSKADLIQEIKNRNDEYLHTVYAIIGFLNAYKYELRNSDDVVIFQGRKLYLDEQKIEFVTPDFGLAISEKKGLVGEVKYSFPLDQTHWQDIFQQIHKYSQIIKGWPTSNELVDEYDIVLLVHQTRARRVVDYYIQSLPEELKIKKTFAIIEFNHSSQGKEYFNFRIEHGNLREAKLHDKFYNGLAVPFNLLIAQYSKVRIYDVQPHLSFLLNLIYECMLDKSITERIFKKLTPKAKIIIETSVLEITHLLRETYSFKGLQSTRYTDGQPEFPKQEWIRNGIDKLIQLGEAGWIDHTTGKLAYYLTAKEGSILDYYIEKCIEQPVKQIEMFENPPKLD